MALVAAHAWDILGARRAGLLTAWVSRKETTFHPTMGTPTVVGPDVAEAVAALARLPAP
jgi:2-haloacid dehalogenase